MSAESPPSAASPDARLVDLGFTRFQGERRGRLAAVASLARWSALYALGARRPWTAKLVPVALVLLAFGPALVVLGAKALVGNRFELPEILPYNGYYDAISIVVLAFVAVATPELLCPDRRDRVLDLYLATAVSRTEYLAGKLLAAVVPILFLTFVPQFTLFAGNAIFDEDAIGYVRDNIDVLPRIIAVGLMLALYYALIGLAVSSLTDRRPFAVGGFLGLMLLSSAIAGALGDLIEGAPQLGVLALPWVPIAMVEIVFGSDELDEVEFSQGWFVASYVAVVAVSALVLAARYRRTSA